MMASWAEASVCGLAELRKQVAVALIYIYLQQIKNMGSRTCCATQEELQSECFAWALHQATGCRLGQPAVTGVD